MVETVAELNAAPNPIDPIVNDTTPVDGSDIVGATGSTSNEVPFQGRDYGITSDEDVTLYFVERPGFDDMLGALFVVVYITKKDGGFLRSNTSPFISRADAIAWF